MHADTVVSSEYIFAKRSECVLGKIVEIKPKDDRADERVLREASIDCLSQPIEL